MQLTPLPFVSDATYYFERLHHLPCPVLLDSNQPASHFGRYDIMSAQPSQLIKVANGISYIDQGQGFVKSTVDPFTFIEQCLAQLTIDDKDCQLSLPFYGGAIGLFSYDYGRQLECMPTLAEQDIDVADLWVGIYDWALINDHHTQRCWLLSHFDDTKHQSLQQLFNSDTVPATLPPFSLTSAFTSNMTAQEYQAKFTAIMDYIHAGDCYQVCLAQRFAGGYQGHPWGAYKQLRQQAPTPFAAYIETDKGAVISLSPERFLEVKELTVETRPIKGTRPRGATHDEDQKLIQALSASTKDKAENLMIVDLLRNDLSKKCLPGSVKVADLFAIESYANVHHMVTSIKGSLVNTQHIVPLLKSAFPGGSITGAPKIRAMEIIEELEPHRRNAYTGSIGYISYHGQMDTNILIRTLVATYVDGDNKEGGDIYCWAGGGIVADSNGTEEYAETFAKVSNLIQGLPKID